MTIEGDGTRTADDRKLFGSSGKGVDTIQMVGDTTLNLTNYRATTKLSDILVRSTGKDAVNVEISGTDVVDLRGQDVRLFLKDIDALTITKDAELVILAVPVGVMEQVIKDIAPYLRQGCVITDTGSTKRSVIRDVLPFVPEASNFIPGHPLAGTEFSGPAAGFASLFEKRYWLILPNESPEDKVAGLATFLSDLGAMVETMDADYHDRVLAITSHLPHLIAYTIVGTAVGQTAVR